MRVGDAGNEWARHGKQKAETKLNKNAQLTHSL